MGTVVEISTGRLAGRHKDGVLRFGGIPYAAPPVGDCRFGAPEPAPPWTGERDATGFGPVAPQRPGALESIAGAAAPDWDEDCLTLNVWTPALDAGRRPVMVWIHGGGFTAGSGSVPWYRGNSFVEHGDVVVVTINYRLGALGWLYLDGMAGAETTASNAGLLDQVAALRWVRDNIAAFGGDPGNVTIFGESAGGMSVATLMGTPAASGLFHRAIAQSGAAQAVASPADAAEVADRLIAALSVTDVAGLRAVPAGDLLAAQSDLAESLTRERAQRPSANFALLPFTPVLDGAVLPTQPLDAIAHGAAPEVSLMTGTTREEWRLFGLMLRSIEDEATLLRRVGRICEDPHAFVDAYRQSADDPDHDQIWTAVMTDRVFRIPAIRLAEAQGAHAPTWMYQFDWASTAFDGRLGSCHALEIPFVFDVLGRSGADLFTGPDAPQSLADTMHGAWLAFARDGDPGWDRYDTLSRATMHFDTTCEVRHDPAAEARAAWDGLI